jgi:hypothetical protein
MPVIRRASRARAAVQGDWSFACKQSTYVWTKEDYDALRSAALDLNTTPEDLLLVMELESGRNPRRAFCNASGYPTANGLNQITKVNAGAMKITEEERLSLLNMTAAEQMPYVVRSFLAARGGKPFPTAPDAVTLYQTNIAPGTVPNDVIFRQKVSPCPPASKATDYYCANAGLDIDKDGVITRSDLAAKLDKIAERQGYQNALRELRGEVEVPSAAEQNEALDGIVERASSSAPPVLLLGGLAAGAFFLIKGLNP